MLTILSYGEGKCCWCCQTAEGVQTKFQDGLSGFLCKKDFWAAVKARAEQMEQSDSESSSSRKTTGSHEIVSVRGGT